MTLLLLYKENPKFLIPQTLTGGRAAAAATFSVTAALAMPAQRGPRDSGAAFQAVVQETLPPAHQSAGGSMVVTAAALGSMPQTRDGITRPAAGAANTAPVPAPQARAGERAPEIAVGGFQATVPAPPARAGERPAGAPGEAFAGVLLPATAPVAQPRGSVFSYGQVTLTVPQARRPEGAPAPVFAFGFFFAMPAARRSERQVPPPASVTVIGTVSASLPQARGLERGAAAISGLIVLDLAPAPTAQGAPAAQATGHVVSQVFAQAVTPERAAATAQFGPAVYFTFPIAPGPRDSFALAKYVIRAFGARVYVEIEEMPRVEIDFDDGVSG